MFYSIKYDSRKITCVNQINKEKGNEHKNRQSL